MCGQHSGDAKSSPSSSGGLAQAESFQEPFPWDVGVFDAHCHPTDTMASIASIPTMRARALTVMSTRSQDQDLVFDVASRQDIKDGSDLPLSPGSSDVDRVVPSFGWHPWFSYQLYDDSSPNSTYDGTLSGKGVHYDKVLTPSPSSRDASFSQCLPDPQPLSKFLSETRTRLEKNPLALVGEVGLDKAFRLPRSWPSAHEAQRDEGLTPGGREGRTLSPYRVQITHQAAVLQPQLRLAGEMGRAVSIHGVQAHGVLFDTIAACWKGHEKEVVSRRQQKQVARGAEDFSSSSDDEDGGDARADFGSGRKSAESRPYPPRICLHSFSGSVEILKQYTHPSIPAKIFFSFSTLVNWGAGGSEKTEEVIRATPDDRILAESDLHAAGDPMDQYLEDACRRICKIKGWNLREGVEQLGRNWREFVFG
ncbi:hydrolase [Xylariaceae sp. FL0662B]|nr:hydrolase [Xylariaceae sp. FL0662B]